MNDNSTQEANHSDLTQRKSLLIIQAQFQQALGQHTEAARLFLDAARLEEQLATLLQDAGDNENAAISLYSAASCYKQAGRVSEAITFATNALSLTTLATFAEEIRQFRDECQQSLKPAGPRTLRGIVRNGAVYPSELGLLSEGEWVTITTV
jgi:tetratricopeptide (TPR) repeat protein